ncbi:macro domain-containing protein [Reyranella sp.]|uniref:macro domain-containing protein n=1 Tax=Reyranella sp. TaxID=1929291 RepID=UPI00120DB293|nr:macro domain-containing protein [Reyranella sp.]TAJ82083.1 MAG: hypothetical protein EPO50_27705 [Reyranella sp.]
MIEPSAFFFPFAKTLAETYAPEVVGGSSLVAIIYSILATKDPIQIHFPIKTTTTEVWIRFGDLFEADGHVVIAVNEFFDSEIGRPVAPSSVHGQFITRVLGGNANRFNADVDRSLDGTASDIVDRPEGRPRRYPLGTTAILHEGRRKYFLFALTKTDPVTCEANADVPQMWSALLKLWDCVRVEANGERVCMPLIGAGLARINLEPTHLLRLALLSLLVQTRSRTITSQIEIVLHKSLIGRIDLRAVRDDWR